MSTKDKKTPEEWEELGRARARGESVQYPTRDLYAEAEENAFLKGFATEQAAIRRRQLEAKVQIYIDPNEDF